MATKNMAMRDETWGLLLDLDETLVRTAAIEHLRAKRAWQDVYRSFALTSLPAGTAAFLAMAARLVQLGVVTMSPRSYAERLLAHHRLTTIPVLVAYHDVQRRKPYPDPIVKAAGMLGCAPRCCLYVGDRPDDIEAAARAGAVPVAMIWPDQKALPTLPWEHRTCHSWDDVLALVEEVVKTRP